MSKSNDVLSLVYDVWISGYILDTRKKSCIESIEIKETTDKSDSATIKLLDPDFIFIEDDIFVEDNTIKIRLGWSNTTHREEFNGYISAIDISFPESGIPTLTLTCMDRTHLMNRVKKNNTFNNCTSAEVVQKVMSSYGYPCVIDSTYEFPRQETITQSNQTDIEFLQKLASEEVYPFTARMFNNKFYYVRKGTLGDSVMKLSYLKYPHDIISLDLKINKESKKDEISKAKVETGDKKVTSSTGEMSSTGQGSVSPSPDTTKGDVYTYIPSTKTWSKIEPTPPNYTVTDPNRYARMKKTQY